MAQRVLDSDYLCPNYVGDKAQDVVNKVSGREGQIKTL